MTLQELTNAFIKAKDAEAEATAKRRSAETKLTEVLDTELTDPLSMGVYVRIGDSVVTKEYGVLNVSPIITLDGSMPIVETDETKTA